VFEHLLEKFYEALLAYLEIPNSAEPFSLRPPLQAVVAQNEFGSLPPGRYTNRPRRGPLRRIERTQKVEDDPMYDDQLDGGPTPLSLSPSLPPGRVTDRPRRGPLRREPNS